MTAERQGLKSSYVLTVLYEDNHIIIVSKEPGEIVQGDKTGDRPLSDIVKDYIKERYAKPGAVFLGVVHRLDRPVSGVVVFARTSKALERLNRMFANHEVQKTYHAIVPIANAAGTTASKPLPLAASPSLPASGITLTHWLTRNEKQNKAYAYDHERPDAKKAVLNVRALHQGERYQMVEVNLHTGRHHQIRCQLSKIGFPIKGDLKYGAPRSNPDGSISLHARRVAFEHPVSHIMIDVAAPYPTTDKLWAALSK